VLPDFDDIVSESLYAKQQGVLSEIPTGLQDIETYSVSLRAYNITGLENVRNLLIKDSLVSCEEQLRVPELPKLERIIDDLHQSGKRVVFAMGKGGVGKTSIAAALALGLHSKGSKVHLTTTDPAAHLKFVIAEDSGISISHIDEKTELERYQGEVLAKARETMSDDDIAYIEEDLRSPCTQEIAVFRRFAEIVERADDEVVVIDTAPTGHTLLLLDATQSYHREVERTQGDIPETVKKLLPRLRNADETEVIIVTLAETTPVFEAMRLAEDLRRAGITVKWWVVNSSLYATGTTNQLLQAKSSHEIEWINKVDEFSDGYFAVTQWISEEVSGGELLAL
jgi:arsenite-transporting ATPase